MEEREAAEASDLHSTHDDINIGASPTTCGEEPVCWICLESSGELMLPCQCPRHVHAKCLARWQLQSAGTRRETQCEFCDGTLPDWKAELTPITQLNAPAIMNVNFDGLSYSFEVQPGPEGYQAFTKAIRAAFTLPGDAELNITFTCDEPTSENGGLVTLQGPGAYDAAVHCASISAARRLANGQSWRTDGISVWSGGSDLDSQSESHSRRRRILGFSRRMRLAFQEVMQAARVLR